MVGSCRDSLGCFERDNSSFHLPRMPDMIMHPHPELRVTETVVLSSLSRTKTIF